MRERENRNVQALFLSAGYSDFESGTIPSRIQGSGVNRVVERGLWGGWWGLWAYHKFYIR